jgi:hypothetical protein
VEDVTRHLAGVKGVINSIMVKSNPVLPDVTALISQTIIRPTGLVGCPADGGVTQAAHPVYDEQLVAPTLTFASNFYDK